MLGDSGIYLETVTMQTEGPGLQPQSMYFRTGSTFIDRPVGRVQALRKIGQQPFLEWHAPELFGRTVADACSVV